MRATRGRCPSPWESPFPSWASGPCWRRRPARRPPSSAASDSAASSSSARPRSSFPPPALVLLLARATWRSTLGLASPGPPGPAPVRRPGRHPLGGQPGPPRAAVRGVAARPGLHRGLPARPRDAASPRARSTPSTRVLAIALVPAFCEEALIRGVLLPSLRTRLGVFLAIGLSTLAFALMHDAYRMPFTFAVGLALGALRLRTGSLAPVPAGPREPQHPDLRRRPLPGRSHGPPARSATPPGPAPPGRRRPRELLSLDPPAPCPGWPRWAAPTLTRTIHEARLIFLMNSPIFLPLDAVPGAVPPSPCRCGITCLTSHPMAIRLLRTDHSLGGSRGLVNDPS